MGRTERPNDLSGILGFGVLCIGVIFFAILPLSSNAGRLPGPDILLVLVFLTVIRRPSAAPLWIVFLVVFMADLLWMRAPGLMSAAVILVTEYLRAHEEMTQEIPFISEWAIASGSIAACLIGSTLVLSILSAPSLPYGALLLQVILSCLCYPLLATFARLLFGMGRPSKKDKFGFGGSR